MIQCSKLFSALLFAGCLAILPAVAQAGDGTARVGRLSFSAGTVGYQPAGIDASTQPAINRALFDGDKLWTAKRSRAEVHMGRVVLRLASNTAVQVQELTATRTRLALTQGRVNVTVGDGGQQNHVEIDTPGGAVTLAATGVYTVRVDDDGLHTMLTVRRGSAEVLVGDQSSRVEAEQSVSFADRQSVQPSSSANADGFDAWCSERQRHDDTAVALQYIPPEVVGYEDLDAYGTWRTSQDYGPLWRPNGVANDWAPFQDGRWSYSEAWGWTWNDAAPWGFAPSHYGRWVNADDGWAWAPTQGMADDPYAYAPAVVAMMTLEADVLGVAAAETLMAWVPLAPREPYWGWWPSSTAWVRPANATRGGVVVAVSRITMRNSAGVGNQHWVVPANAVAQLHPALRANALQPSVATVVGAAPHSAALKVPVSLNRVVVAHDALPDRAPVFVDRSVHPVRRAPPPPPPKPIWQRLDLSAASPVPAVYSERVPLHGEHIPPSTQPRPHPVPGWAPHRSFPDVAAPVLKPEVPHSETEGPVIRPVTVPNPNGAKPAVAPPPVSHPGTVPGPATVHPEPTQVPIAVPVQPRPAPAAPAVRPAPMPMPHPMPKR